MAQDNIIPPVPNWVNILRWFELAINVLYLGLIASSLALFAVDTGYYFTFQAVGIFVGSWSLIFLLSVVITQKCARGGYWKWWHLGAEAITMVLWLVAMATTASVASDFRTYQVIEVFNENPYANTIYGLLAAGAFVAAVLFVLFVLTLIFLSIACHRCRVGLVDEHGQLRVVEASNFEMKPDVPYAVNQSQQYQQYQQPPAPQYYAPPVQQQPNMPAGLA